MEIQAHILVLKLEGAAKPGVPACIGAPPPGIERLVADTIATARVVQGAIPDTPPIDEIPAYFAVKRLLGGLDRWEPYIYWHHESSSSDGRHLNPEWTHNSFMERRSQVKINSEA